MNKRTAYILGGLTALVLGSLAFSQFANKGQSSSSNQVAKVGVLQLVSHPSLDEIYKGVEEGLKEEGYSGKKVEIEFLNAEGDQSKIATMSQKLASGKKDVLIGIATPAAQGLASATKDTPIVMGAITDPLGAKLVDSLEKPGGNITGVSDQNPAQQQLDLIKTLTPDVKTIGILYSSSEDNSKTQVEEFTKLAEKAGYSVRPVAVPSTNEIASAMTTLAPKVDAVWVPIDNTIASAFNTVVANNKDFNKPIYPSATAMVEAGGLGSVVVDQHDLGVETGKMAAKVLKGAKPAETPVTIFNTGKIVVNKKVADELGIQLPDSLKKDGATIIE